MGKAEERRLRWRYKVGLPVQFRVTEGKTVSRWRTGRTCNVSTSGVLFRCAQNLPENAHVEMIIGWPAKQGDLYPISLRAAGDVVRIRGRKIAVRMTFCRMVIEKAAPPSMFAAVHAGRSA